MMVAVAWEAGWLAGRGADGSNQTGSVHPLRLGSIICQYRRPLPAQLLGGLHTRPCEPDNYALPYPARKYVSRYLGTPDGRSVLGSSTLPQLQWRDFKAPNGCTNLRTKSTRPGLVCLDYLLFDVGYIHTYIITYYNGTAHPFLLIPSLASSPFCPEHQSRSDHGCDPRSQPATPARSFSDSIDSSTRLEPSMPPRSTCSLSSQLLRLVRPREHSQVLAHVRPAHQATLEAWTHRAGLELPRAGRPRAASSSHPCQPWTSTKLDRPPR